MNVRFLNCKGLVILSLKWKGAHPLKPGWEGNVIHKLTTCGLCFGWGLGGVIGSIAREVSKKSIAGAGSLAHTRILNPVTPTHQNSETYSFGQTFLQESADDQ